jgi:hypothetical protein
MPTQALPRYACRNRHRTLTTGSLTSGRCLPNSPEALHVVRARGIERPLSRTGYARRDAVQSCDQQGGLAAGPAYGGSSAATVS